METQAATTDDAPATAPPPEPKVPAMTKASLVAGGKVSAIVPRDFESTWRLAQVIAKSGMAPESFNGEPEKIVVAIMHGMEVGFTPMAALQSIAVINGRPTIWGDGALGLVRRSGLLEYIHEEVTGEKNEMKGTCRLKRAGEPELERSFSMLDADAAGLSAKKGPWQTYRRRMLQMRARSWALRDGFADVLKGLQIREEVEDYDSVNLHEGSDGIYAPAAGQPAERPTRAAVAAAPKPAPTANDQEKINMAKSPDGAPIVERFPNMSDEQYAAEWAKRLAACETTPALSAFLGANGETLAALEGTELHAEIKSVIAARTTALNIAGK